MFRASAKFPLDGKTFTVQDTGMNKKQPYHSSCTVIRRAFVRRGTVSLATGNYTEDGAAWETKPCGAPLFTDDEHSSGVCRSCASGWTHPENFPAGPDVPLTPEHIRSVSPTLCADLEHWAEYGVRTVGEFGDYLDIEAAHNVFKDINGCRPRFITNGDEARAYLDSADASRGSY